MEDRNRPAFRCRSRAAAGNYAALFRSFDNFRLRVATEEAAQGGAIQGPEGLVREWDKIERESPDVPDRLYDHAVREEHPIPKPRDAQASVMKPANGVSSRTISWLEGCYCRVTHDFA